jgi:NADH:ubiquinone oxidoreductase subunit K
LATILFVVPLSLAFATRSLLLGLVSVPLLLLAFVLLAALTFASIYTSYRDVFALGEMT